jgi:glutamate/tyrosine decarboxylase-like PLP-dependent enzyme
MRTQLPIVGISRDEIFSRMKAFSAGDIDWRRGRVPLYVFKANDEIATLGRDAFLEFFTENALGGKRAFHGLKKMEDDIVSIGLSLFHAPDDAAGFFTTGGSESIICAVLACRDFGRRQSGRADKRGNIVLPYSAHPAFTKAARLMDIELRRIPVATNCRATSSRCRAQSTRTRSCWSARRRVFRTAPSIPSPVWVDSRRNTACGCTSTPASVDTSRRSPPRRGIPSRRLISPCRA